MLEYSELNFECQWESEGEVPVYLGGYLRGLLGSNLRRMLCITKEKDCRQCIFLSRCKYPELYPHLTIGSDIEDNGGGEKRKDSKIPPFLISIKPFVVSEHRENQFGRGKHLLTAAETFTFKIILFGKYCKDAPYFVYAINEIGFHGIGAKDNRIRFSVNRISDNGQEIYSSQSKDYTFTEPLKLSFDELIPDSLKMKEHVRIKLNFITPLRFKYHNKFSDDLDIQKLVLLCYRRVSALFSTFSQHKTEDNPLLDMEKLRDSVTHKNDLTWQDWSRFSFFQDREMKFGGIVGEIEMEGDLQSFIPLIEFASIVHIGKQTVFGLGNFTLDRS